MSVAAPPLRQPRSIRPMLRAGWGSVVAVWERSQGAGWRGPLLAAAIVLVTALPALLAVPPLDRDESRFAQASAQMLETGDFVNIRFQDEPRDKKPVGIHWLQAAAVKLFSSAEARDIRFYRMPSLLGAMIAAAACAWGAALAFGPRGGTVAGAVLGASLLLSSEAFIGKTDAVLCGAVTLCMAGLGRLYLNGRGEAELGDARWEKLAFWGGLGLSILVKGPIGPMTAVLAIAALVIADRRGRWLRDLGWWWGLLLVALIVGPWAFAITVATDGAFWFRAVGSDLAPKLAGAHEHHGSPPGVHSLLTPLLLFPSGFILPAAGVAAWKRREEPGVRFALAWLIPTWLFFELLPTKLVHYPMPLYGALAWLAGAAATSGWRIGPRARLGGAILSALAGMGVGVVALVAAQRYGGGSAAANSAALLTAVLGVASGLVGAVLLLRERPLRALAAAGALGIGAHIALTALLLPHLDAMWTSARAADLLVKAGLDPRDGRTVGPVTVAGYAEPSLVFTLGTDTELQDKGADSAESLAEGAPAIVEGREEAVFLARLKKLGAAAAPMGTVVGRDYSAGRDVRLTVWKPTRLSPAAAASATGEDR